MGNWLSSRGGGGGGGTGDLFSDVRQIQKEIQKSKSQSDIAIAMKLEQPARAKSKFLQQARRGSKSREASGVRSSASVSSVPRALAVAQERAARKRDMKSDKANSRCASSSSFPFF